MRAVTTGKEQRCGRRQRSARIALLWFTVVECLAGCTPRTAQQQQTACLCEALDGGAPVNTALVAFLSKAKSSHHQADLLEEAKDVRGAIDVLDRLVIPALPAPLVEAPEAREVLSDARARLADLRGQVKDFDGAARDIDEGLKLAPVPSYFEGHLYEQRGVNEERRAHDLDARGDHEQARRTRAQSMKAFERAVAIQDTVIRRALDNDGGQPQR